MAGEWTEKRVDPFENRLYTYSELVEVYRGAFSPAEIRIYWDTQMWPASAFNLNDSASAEAVGSASQALAKPSPGKTVKFNEVAASTAGSAASTGSAATAAADPLTKLKSARATFCMNPSLVGGKFTPTYERAPAANFASLNPGDEELGVGGAAMNLQFAKDLWNMAWQNTDEYRLYHTQLFSSADVDRLVEANNAVLVLNSSLQAGFVRKPADGGKVGVAFVDVFRPHFRVHGHAKNIAMIYAVWPERDQCLNNHDFLDLVKATAANISKACVEYNVLADEMGLPRIEVLRVPLVGAREKSRLSSTQKIELSVASAVIHGLVSEHTKDSPEFNFSFVDGIFQRTWNALEAESDLNS